MSIRMPKQAIDPQCKQLWHEITAILQAMDKLIGMAEQAGRPTADLKEMRDGIEMQYMELATTYWPECLIENT